MEQQRKNEKAIAPAPVRSDALLALDRVRHGFFTRKGGVSTGIYEGLNCGVGSDDDKNAVSENRRRVAKALGLGNDRLATLYQVHGDRALYTKSPWAPGQLPKADGLVTDQPGLGLSILTADCTPVLFADPAARIIGACHAGWRGAFEGVIEATLTEMEAHGAERSRVIACAGPCIGQESYQVGPEFQQRFTETDSGWEKYFRDDDEGRYRFDLSGFVHDRLVESGVAIADRIEADTCAEAETYFSYRRSTLTGERDYGRMISTIMIEP